MSNMRKLIREWEAEGWTVERTKGSHYRLTHPDATMAVVSSGTASDHRSIANVRALMRRALRQKEAA